MTQWFFFLNCNQHSCNFKPLQFPSTVWQNCFRIFYLKNILIRILALKMADQGNRHCAKCIGALSFIMFTYFLGESQRSGWKSRPNAGRRRAERQREVDGWPARRRRRCSYSAVATDALPRHRALRSITERRSMVTEKQRIIFWLRSYT